MMAGFPNVMPGVVIGVTGSVRGVGGYRELGRGGESVCSEALSRPLPPTGSIYACAPVVAKVATIPLNGFVIRLSDSREAWNTLKRPHLTRSVAGADRRSVA